MALTDEQVQQLDLWLQERAASKGPDAESVMSGNAPEELRRRWYARGAREAYQLARIELLLIAGMLPERHEGEPIEVVDIVKDGDRSELETDGKRYRLGELVEFDVNKGVGQPDWRRGVISAAKALDPIANAYIIDAIEGPRFWHRSAEHIRRPAKTEAPDAS